MLSERAPSLVAGSRGLSGVYRACRGAWAPRYGGCRHPMGPSFASTLFRLSRVSFAGAVGVGSRFWIVDRLAHGDAHGGMRGVVEMEMRGLLRRPHPGARTWAGCSPGLYPTGAPVLQRVRERAAHPLQNLFMRGFGRMTMKVGAERPIASRCYLRDCSGGHGRHPPQAGGQTHARGVLGAPLLERAVMGGAPPPTTRGLASPSAVHATESDRSVSRYRRSFET
jgi:hypothetical protein